MTPKYFQLREDGARRVQNGQFRQTLKDDTLCEWYEFTNIVVPRKE